MIKRILLAVTCYAVGCHYVLGIEENVDAAYEHENFITRYTSDAEYLWSLVLAEELQPVSLALDSAMNIVMIGSYTSSPNLGDGKLKDGGQSGLFLAKVRPDGTLVWSRGFGEIHSPNLRYSEIATFPPSIGVDDSDNIIITGSFSKDGVDFGDGLLPYGETEEDLDIFLAKFDSEGNGVFAKRFFGLNPKTNSTKSTDHGNAVDTDAEGNIYLAATAKEDVEIDKDNVVNGTFLAAFTPEGETRWAKTLSQEVGDLHLSVSGDGHALLSGGQMGPVDLGGGIIGDELGDFDIATFAATFDPNGNHVRSTHFGHCGCVGVFTGGGATMDAEGNMIVASTQPIDGELPRESNNWTVSYRIFLRKMSNDGKTIWNTTVDLDLERFEANIHLNPPIVDGTGDVLLSGLFTGTLRVGDGDALGGESDGDAFLIKFDSDGNHRFSLAFERAIPIASQPVSFSFVTTSVATDDQNNFIFMSGSPRSSL